MGQKVTRKPKLALSRFVGVVFGVVTVVTIAWVSGTDFLIISRVMEQNTGQEGERLAKQVLRTIGNRADSEVQVMKFMGGDPAVISVLTKVNTGMSLSSGESQLLTEQIKRMEASILTSSGAQQVDDLAYVTLDGRVIAGQSERKLAVYESTWIDTVQKNGVYWGLMWNDPSEGRVEQAVAVLIKDESGNPVAILRGELNLVAAKEELSRIERTTTVHGLFFGLSFSTMSDYVLINSKNQVVYSTEEEDAELSSFDAELSSEVNQIRGGGATFGSFVGEEDYSKNGKMQFSFATENNSQTGDTVPTGLTVIVERQMKDVYIRAFGVIVFNLLVMIVGGGAVAFLTWLYLKRSMITPISEIAMAAEAIQHGDYAVTLKKYGSNEIGTLARNFNQMTKTLESTIEEAADLNDELKVINQMIRHDVNNRLIYVLYNLNSVRHANGFKKEYEQVIENIAITAESAIGFIQSTQEIEKGITSNNDLEEIDIAEVVEKVQKEHFDMEVVLHGNAKVKGDEALYSVFTNLVRNAQVHGRVSRVDISVAKGKGVVSVRVADNGKGIPDEVKGKLFQKGFKHGETGHTGIGLFVTRRTIERYGGRIWVEDNEPRGTVFVFELPNN